MSEALTSRRASAEDHETFLRLFPELATGDPLPTREQWEGAIAPSTLFFESGGEIVAYAFHQTLNETGYLRHLVVDPAHRGRRIGRAVMDELAAMFRRAGCSRWELNVKPDNAPAVRLYRSVGMEPVFTSTALRLDWSVVEALPRPARPVIARLVDPSRDALIERRHALPAGMLGSNRALPAKVLLELVEPVSDEPLGVASFDVHFPGAFPFRVTDPTLAQPLLEAMKAHALPEHAHVGVVAEDDAGLARHLLDHGAVVRLEIVHYSGAL